MKNFYKGLTTVFTIAIFVTLFSDVKAQSAANYTYSTSTGNSLNSMTGSTQLVADNQDDAASPITNIGFEFWFMGVRYTQFGVNSNGVLRLGAVVPAAQIVIGTAAQARIAAFADNLYLGGNSPAGKVHYLLSGTSPSQKLTIEWLNMNIDNGSIGNNGSFQIILYESIGKIEFIYSNPMSAGNASNASQGAQIGFSSNNVATSTIRSVTLAATPTSASTLITNSYAAAAITGLQSGRLISFTPPTTNTAPTSLTFSCITNNSTTLNWVGGTNLSRYAVYRATVSGGPYIYVADVASGTLTYNATGLTAGTNYFWRVYSINEGNQEVFIQNSQITQNPVAAASPSSGICPGSTTNLSVTGELAGSTYQWQSSPVGAGSWADISGATTDPYTATLTNSTDFRIIVTKSGFGCTATSTGITVTTSPSAGTASASQSYCPPTIAAPLTLIGSVGAVQWQQSTTSTTSGFSNIIGATSTTYAPGLVSTTTYYRAIVTFAGCPDATSNVVTISIVSDATWLGGTGNWSDVTKWDIGSVPAACMNVTIPSGAVTVSAAANCANLTVNTGASLTIATSQTLTMSGNLLLNGYLDNVGKLTMSAATPSFTMGATGTYIHEPSITPANANSADMFVKGIESFDLASTLIIKSWYAVATPIAADMQGNYGNLVIEPNSGTVVYSTVVAPVRWFQNNLLTNKIKGNLTIGNVYLVVAPTPPTGTVGITGAITLDVTGDIILNSANSFLTGLFHFNNTPLVSSTATVNFIAKKIIQSNGLFKGIDNLNLIGAAVTGALTITTTQGIEVSGGIFYGGLSGNGTAAGGSVNVNSAITLSNAGAFYGVQDCTVPLSITASGITQSNTSILIGQNYTLLPTNGNITLNAGSLNLSGSSIFTCIGGGNGSVTVGNNTPPNVTIAGTAVFTGIQAFTDAPNSSALAITTGNIDITGGSFTGNNNGSGVNTVSTGAITLSGGAIFNNLTGTTSTPASGTLNFSSTNINLVSGTPTFNLGGANATGTFTASTTGAITVNAGVFNIKKETGAATLNIGSNCSITGGAFNYFLATGAGSVNSNAIAMTINGNFLQSGGIFDFDKVATNTGARTLSVKGDFTHSGGTFRNFADATSTVTLNGTSAQTMTGPTATTFYNLTINNSSTGVTLSSAPVAVNNTLTLTNGLFTLGNSDLTLGTAATAVAGTPSATKMIVTDGTGVVRKLYTAIGAYVFPVGDNTGTAEYSPITLDFPSGTPVAGANATVKVVNAKHPNNGSNTNFLTRYWSTTVSGITAYTATVTGTYVNADIAGTEASIANGRYSGSLPWTKTGTVDATNNAVTFTGINALGDFTGITLAAPTVTITGPTSRCFADAPTQLTAVPVGDATFTYLWSPATGLSSTTIVNPTANPPLTTTYTVTATDANGFSATSPGFTLTVNPNPTITLGASPSVCAGSSSANLPYTATTATPNKYTIDFDATAEAAGFVDVASTNLPVSPISVPVSATAASGTYNASIVVQNSTTGCSSLSTAFTITLTPAPTITLGTSPTVCRGTTSTGLPYTALTDNPTQYSIDYDATANTAGFADVAFTLIPGSPIPITVPGAAPEATYNATITVKNVTTGCTSPATAFTVNVTGLPTISLGTDPSVCRGATSADLEYLATTGFPDQYTIDYNAAAEGAGFVDVSTFTTLPTTPIVLTIPANAAAATYDATITVRNSSAGCPSTAFAFTVTVNALPTITLGTSPTVCTAVISADLPYTATTGDTYTYDFDDAANTAGFDDVAIETSFSGSPIEIPVPLAPGGIYNATIKVQNATTGCNSIAQAFTVTINDPTISLGTSPTVNIGATTAELPFTATSGSPNKYIINFDAIAEGQGFSDVSTYTNFTTSPITINMSGAGVEGTYDGTITVKNSSTGCISFDVPFTVTITAANAPTISLGSNPSICQGVTTANLNYTAVTNTPNKYSINFDSDAELEGFVDVVLADMTTSPIVITVPFDATVGTYNATIIVTNTTTTVNSSPKAFTITIRPPTPSTPGTISGLTPVCPGTTGISYSIAAVPDATTYTWAVPGTGWSITAGNGTTTITATSGSAGDNGNITVTAGNDCGTSTAASKAVVVSPATPATPGVISGTTPVCPGTTGHVYSIVAVANASSYIWTVPTGWTITAGSTTNSITVTSGTIGGNITVKASNSCGTSTASSLAVTLSPAKPGTPGPISGLTTVCPNITNLTYSVAAVTDADANGYTWTVPAGWSITAGGTSNSITVTSGNAGQNGNITVTATNSCGTSAIAQTLAVTVSPGTPATPGIITGTTPVCPNTSGLTYSIDAVSTATTYNWLVPTNWTITAGAGTNQITVTSGNFGDDGDITVSAQNSCGTSATNSIAVAIKPGVPATPGIIDGQNPVCPGSSWMYYYISDVADADSYTWTIPATWTFEQNYGTTYIYATSGASGGDITVTATNSCGTSAASTLTVTMNPAAPSTPGIINGSIEVCPIETGLVYDISAVPNATDYYWYVPYGWIIDSGFGTASITVTAGNTGEDGDILVYAGNSCGYSYPPSSLAVTVKPGAPLRPGIISGNTIVCPGIANITYSISPVNNATNYNWTVPTGWTITSGNGTTTIRVTSGSSGQNGIISVTAENSCGISSARNLAVTVSPGKPATPGPISGATAVCPGSTQSYSIASVTNATSYNWTVPIGWVITTGGTGNSITVTAGYFGEDGTITVSAQNSCGVSTAQSLAVTVNPPIPETPGAVNGPTTVCPGSTSLTYDVSAVPYATTYNWVVPNGWVITSGAGTNQITVTSGNYSEDGYIFVSAENSCGTSSISYIYATISPATPATPGTINGTTTVCPGITGLTYDVSDVPYASIYNWTVPTGWTISSGQGTNQITVISGNAGQNGNITVTAGNSCGTSLAASLAVTVSPATPATPGAISGNASVCTSTTGINYNISAVANATSYGWAVPTGWTITAGGTSNSITVTSGSTGGNVMVTASNSCGTSAIRSLAVTITPSVTPAVSIAQTTGSNPTCSGQSLSFTASPTNGGTTPAYQWKVNGANVGTNSSTFNTSALTNGQVVSCVLTSNANCASPITGTSNSITMTVIQTVTPSVVIAITTGSNPSCAGNAVTFTATPSNGGTGPSYQWKVNGTNMGNNSSTFSSSTITNGQVVSCVMTSNATCTTTANGTSNNITMSITPSVTPSVVIALTTGSNPSCAGNSLTFTATPTNGGSTPIYQWKVDGTNVGSNATTFTTASLTNGQIVTCVLTSNALCANPVSNTSNGITMSVNSILAPAVSINITTGSNPSCSDNVVTFTATPTNGGSTPSYQWKVNGINKGANSATFTSSALANNDVVVCVLSSSYACASPTTATSNGTTMVITPVVTPLVSIALSAGSNPTCVGQIVTYKATATNGGNTPTYQWKVNGVNVGANNDSYSSSSYANNDVLSCVLTSSATCASPATSTSPGVNISVLSNVTPSVTTAISSGSNPSCQGNSVSFFASPTNGGSTPVYQWKVNGANVGLNNATFTTTALANNDVVTVAMTSNAKCANPLNANSTGITMSITPLVTPAVSIAITSGANPSCEGNSVTFTATPTNGGSTPVYQWKRNGAVVGTNSSTYSSNALLSDDVISCVLTSNAACSSTTTATSNSTKMSITPVVNPTVTIAITSGSNPTCPEAEVIFTATSTNGGTTPTYQWKLNNASVVGATSTTFSSTSLANNDLVKVELTSSLNCVSGTKFTSNVITMGLTGLVKPTLSIVISEGSNQACSGQEVVLRALPGNGGKTPSFQWKIDGNNVGADNIEYSSASWPDSCEVTCIMTSSLDCADPLIANSEKEKIVFYSTPEKPVITKSGSILTSSSLTGNQWYLNNDLIPGATERNFKTKYDGDYTVIATSTHNCSSETSDVLKVAKGVGLDELSVDEMLRVYPNPNDGNFTIFFTAENKANYRLELSNELGQLVYKEELKDFSGDYSKLLNVQELGKGFYMISVRSNSYQAIGKVIVY